MFFQNKYRYWFILALAVYTYVNTAICRVYDYFELPIYWYQAFLSILLITFLSWEWSRLIQPSFSKWFHGDEHINKRLLSFFGLGLAGSIILTIMTVVSFEVFVLHVPMSLDNPLKLTLTYASLITLLFHLLNAVVFYMQKYKSKQLEAEELLRMNTQAQLQSIRSQINPHFLFNNLNVLSSLVMKSSDEANDFIEAFSKVYHYILRNQDKELIELQKEVDFLQPYMYLLQKRFPAGIELKTEIDERWNHAYVVPVALQMLVENAIKHNIVSHIKPLEIKIKANGTAVLEVSNNLQPKANREPSSNIGLNNINQRYELITGRKIEVVKNQHEFKVSLPLIEIG
ncbi:sensor histidine kinase [Lacibacter sediminis]|uniref:Histidine kinase n=1 Tax=Lacibacter sediminis TaxID=2760713 RepID=A0A7G5XH94_9BACT|nr:histidine kinase [Lacibacter sediminis]QNA44847.1 histidine kinase [Lacibacter sediminis]